MFRLVMPTEPVWLDLPHGVRVQVKPLTAAVEGAAIAAAGAAVRDREFADDTERTYATANALACGLARYGVVAWEGVAGPDGAPLPVTPDAAAALASHPDMAADFLAKYRGMLAPLAAEGNASASAPNGSAAEA